jgi:hypothetical protein
MADGEKPLTQGKKGENVPSQTFEGYETVDMSFTRGHTMYRLCEQGRRQEDPGEGLLST